MSNLLASAPSLDAINESVTRFYCGESKTLKPEPGKADSWLVCWTHDEEPLLGVRVVKRGRRYRFEMVI